MTIARRRQVHEAPRRLQVGLRVARPRRHRPPARGSGRPRIEAEEVEREGAERVLGGRRRHPRPRRLRHARDRGEDRGDPLRPRTRHAVLRHLPGHAVRRHRVRPQRASGWRTPTAPSSTRRRRTRSSACWTSSSRSRSMGGTMRLGAYPCDADARQPGAPGATAPTRSTSGTGTATSSTTTTASSSRRTAWSSPARAPTASSSR